MMLTSALVFCLADLLTCERVPTITSPASPKGLKYPMDARRIRDRKYVGVDVATELPVLPLARKRPLAKTGQQNVLRGVSKRKLTTWNQQTRGACPDQLVTAILRGGERATLVDRVEAVQKQLDLPAEMVTITFQVFDSLPDDLLRDYNSNTLAMSKLKGDERAKVTRKVVAAKVCAGLVQYMEDHKAGDVSARMKAAGDVQAARDRFAEPSTPDSDWSSVGGISPSRVDDLA
eukprot:TRINITY_DN33024_c0_g1_i1.p1 TRINITY_DN33024_c0_g1~~TRINITY_DN33024_c0_g1_i1.p1  ORF type:complete len:233 (-),score=23.67 TRINITY_DN33024_c0_g1_i1:54-752(-)